MGICKGGLKHRGLIGREKATPKSGHMSTQSSPFIDAWLVDIFTFTRSDGQGGTRIPHSVYTESEEGNASAREAVLDGGAKRSSSGVSLPHFRREPLLNSSLLTRSLPDLTTTGALVLPEYAYTPWWEGLASSGRSGAR